MIVLWIIVGVLLLALAWCYFCMARLEKVVLMEADAIGRILFRLENLEGRLQILEKETGIETSPAKTSYTSGKPSQPDSQK